MLMPMVRIRRMRVLVALSNMLMQVTVAANETIGVGMPVVAVVMRVGVFVRQLFVIMNVPV